MERGGGAGSGDTSNLTRFSSNQGSESVSSRCHFAPTHPNLQIHATPTRHTFTGQPQLTVQPLSRTANFHPPTTISQRSRHPNFQS